ncbi:DUF418 domain-containing protein [Myceligenerans sp. TRM 65318]|uniref:DUF418 domain-containing protein n=2 Tax=Myceligenerans pegani TaxID=2776917 RepID=A0ABR9N4J7_9MICO|nr:DUF418 domain-containing protein [Myceligenerans sp. TRM 65318]MBE3020855.1 DUF418 domain-containing protein [Myceligenerans sp. TRM 65318]
MLLLIAMANTTWYLWGREHAVGSGHPVDGSPLDRATDVVLIVAVDMRVYPMFAFLFGYGMVQLYSRQVTAGTSPARARRLLQARNLWLLAFGFVHAALLWMGDVLGAYGVAGLLLVWMFFRRADGTLLAWAGALLGLLAAGTAVTAVGAYAAARIPAAEAAPVPGSFVDPSISLTSYAASVPERLDQWVYTTLGQGIADLVVPMMILLAFWAARRRVLENPGDHLPLLRRVAATCVPLGLFGGLPNALDHVGVLGVPSHAEGFFLFVQMVTGFFGGLGYVALWGLAGHAVARRRGLAGSAVARRRADVPAAREPVARVRVSGIRPGGALAVDGLVAGALQAVGQRSLTCYLLQSVLCAPVLAAWGLGLGQHLSSFTMLLYAAAVWGLTVLFAAWQEDRDARGPAEILLRRLTYRS